MEIMVLGGRNKIGGNSIACFEGSSCVILDSGFRNSQKHPVPDFHFIRKWGLSYESITDVIISHAHFDHYGGLPHLFDKGFQGRVLSSEKCKTLLEFITSNPYIDPRLNDIEKSYISHLFFKIRYKLSAITNPTNFKVGEFESSIQTASHMEGSIITHLQGKFGDILYLGDVGMGFTRSLSSYPERPDYMVFDASLFYHQSTYLFDKVLEVFRVIVETSIDLQYPLVFPVNPLGYQQKIMDLIEPILLGNNTDETVYLTPLSQKYQQLLNYSGHLKLKTLSNRVNDASIIIGVKGDRSLKQFRERGITIYPSKFGAGSSYIEFTSISHLEESSIRKKVVPGASFYLPISLHSSREEILDFASVVQPRLAIPIFGGDESPIQKISARKLWEKNNIQGKLIFPKIGEIVK